MKEGAVHQALNKLTRTLDALGIPYAIIGAMALNEFGRAMAMPRCAAMAGSGPDRSKLSRPSRLRVPDLIRAFA